MPLAESGWHVLRREGVGSFAIKLRRAIGKAPTHPVAFAQRLDLRRFKLEECLEVVKHLEFKTSASPEVSIIIPIFNQFIFTVECLASISRNPQQASFELILIDDASDEKNIALLAEIPGVRYLRNDTNAGFIHSCNRGVEAALGKYVYFLNNDTQVQEQWLDPLIRRLESTGIGLVGSKLLFPDGTLQEAGARLVRSPKGDTLTGDLIGMGSLPSESRYCLPREVEYCSGASLLIRRDLYLAVGGLDTSYAPAYFEDVDLAYKVRKAGYRVFYEPASEVVHHLSASAGDKQEAKRHQVTRNAHIFLSRWGDELAHSRRIRLLAFYLPQYHPIPENDEWWGKGFTEWTNVTKAKPNFTDHYQPHLSTELGFYDLRLAEARREQAMLAKQYGLYGFCYYYYWFNGRRLLNRPLDEVLASGEPDFPFCICWANENWTRTWDGKDNQVLIAQRHSDEDDVSFIQSLFSALRDSRYIRIGNKPLILVYKAGLLPDPARTALLWREQCRLAGIGEVYLACVHNSSNPNLNPNPSSIGFDAAVEFPPAGKGVLSKTKPDKVSGDFKGLFYDYRATMQEMLSSGNHAFTFFRGVMPSWDNTPRRQHSSHIFLGSSPDTYRNWLEAVLEWTDKMHIADERIVFVNAWNEWGEGNHLEPDRRYGRGYLEATQAALARYTLT